MSSTVGQSGSEGEFVETGSASPPRNPQPAVADAEKSEAVVPHLKTPPTASAVASSVEPEAVEYPNTLFTSSKSASGVSAFSNENKRSGSQRTIGDGQCPKADTEESYGSKSSEPVVIAVIGSKGFVDLRKDFKRDENVGLIANYPMFWRRNGRYIAGSLPGLKRVLPSELEFINRVKNLPFVRIGYGVYLRSQEYQLLAMPVNVTKRIIDVACFPVSFVASPAKRLCKMPISIVDHMLCKCLDVAETLFPCIAVPPNQMMEVTKDAVVNCICFCPRATERGMQAVCPKKKSA